ncbi:MAG: sensor histidine kinase [Acidobacteriota bacterium]
MKTMARSRRTQIVASYVLSLVVVVALLVVWVVYVVQSKARIDDLADRVGVSVGQAHWAVLLVGCGLAVLLIVELTSQLAKRFADYRYTRKQEEFVATVTHELRTPLAAIKLHAQTLERNGVSGAERQRSLGFILQEAERMETLVEDVLESSRLVARRKRLELHPVSLEDFFRRYAEEATVRVETRGVRFTSRLETKSVVLATEDALKRLLDNLVENAVRFSQPGGEVRCRVRDHGSRAVIEVEDDGVGIPKKELKRVFDRFYQVTRSGGVRGPGTGLGLFIVSGLVRELRGEIRAFSHEGRPGTRFRIELPAAGEAA